MREHRNDQSVLRPQRSTHICFSEADCTCTYTRLWIYMHLNFSLSDMYVYFWTEQKRDCHTYLQAMPPFFTYLILSTVYSFFLFTPSLCSLPVFINLLLDCRTSQLSCSHGRLFTDGMASTLLGSAVGSELNKEPRAQHAVWRGEPILRNAQPYWEQSAIDWSMSRFVSAKQPIKLADLWPLVMKKKANSSLISLPDAECSVCASPTAKS